MRQFNLRIDDDVYQTLLQKSTERGIKISRYTRNLIEKGLVVDYHFHYPNPQGPLDKSSIEGELELRKMVLENNLMLKRIYKSLHGNVQDFEASMTEISHEINLSA